MTCILQLQLPVSVVITVCGSVSVQILYAVQVSARHTLSLGLNGEEPYCASSCSLKASLDFRTACTSDAQAAGYTHDAHCGFAHQFFAHLIDTSS